MSPLGKTIVDEQPQAEHLSPLTVPLGEDPDDLSADAVPRGPLGLRLLGADLIAPDELEAALSHQAEKGQKLGESLLELGFASEEQLLPFIETQRGVAGVRRREGLLDELVHRVELVHHSGNVDRADHLEGTELER